MAKTKNKQKIKKTKSNGLERVEITRHIEPYAPLDGNREAWFVYTYFHSDGSDDGESEYWYFSPRLSDHDIAVGEQPEDYYEYDAEEDVKVRLLKEIRASHGDGIKVVWFLEDDDEERIECVMA